MQIWKTLSRLESRPVLRGPRVAQGGPAAMAGRTHLSPSRTQKLSAPAADIVVRQNRHAAGQPALLSSLSELFFLL